MMPVRYTLVGTALLVSIAGLLYSSLKNIPGPVGTVLTAAFAVEACLYVTSMTEQPRKWLQARFRKPALALLLTLSAAVPFLIYSIPTGVFSWPALALILAAAAVLSFYYVLLPRRPVLDLLFMVVVASGFLSPLFPACYPEPAGRLGIWILGVLMWTRLAVFAALVPGGMAVSCFGMLPSRRDWAIGTLHFLLFVPVGALVGWTTGFAAWHLRPAPWWQTLGIAVAIFFGMLWVVALREEFFFRGLLQEWLTAWLRSSTAGLVAASILFGLVHLPFRGFPNWRFALLATLAGLFYGRAYLAGRSVRAAMVTHALVNTAWRVFFS